MIEKFKMDFPAFTGDTQRKVYVYLPKGYESSKESYPVLYMFDGHNAFWDKEATYGRSCRLGRYLDKNKVKLIVVGVDCHHGENNERCVEYSPFDVNLERENVHFEGQGKDTMDWFVSVLKPAIDKKYRTLTDREHTYIMGSSMGGIMATYALLFYNQYFSKAASLSPAYHIYGKDALNNYKNFELVGPTCLYTDYGTDDLWPKRAIPQFTKMNLYFVKRGVDVTSRIIPKGFHNEAVWEKQLPFAIGVLMYEGVKKHV